MPVTKNLTVPYHAAVSPEMDGPATVQMILDEIGKAPLPDQGAIDTSIKAHNTEPDYWYSDPDGVAGALNELKPPPPTFNNAFVLSSRPTENEISRLITSTLHNYQVATATLVYSGGHWVAVKGVRTDVDPLTNPSYSIDGFWIHNPWPDDPVAGAVSQDAWIDYETWVDTYLTPVVYGPPGGKWLNQFVTVRDPNPPAVGELRPLKQRARADGRQLLAPEQALAFARTECEERGLLGHDRFQAVYQRGRPAKPLVVQRLDRPTQTSYLIPWMGDDGIGAFLTLDARRGVLREAAVPTKAGRFALFDREEILRRLAEGALEVVRDQWAGCLAMFRRNALARLVLRPGAWRLLEELVWLPCWESRSPAFPFYVLAVGRRRFYISTLNGRIYERLHAFRRGGTSRGGA